jgi:hypothetical protein
MVGDLCCTVPGPIGEMTMCTKPTEAGTCPAGCDTCRCTSPDTPIATPAGERPIASLKEGDLVYSVHQGRVTVVPVLKAESAPARDHVVVSVTLESGAVLQISPRHPTADGRTFADLTRGAAIDGVLVTGTRAVPYAHDRTYDILPGSDSATYFAAGVLIGSTLAPNAPAVSAPTAPLCSAR